MSMTKFICDDDQSGYLATAAGALAAGALIQILTERFQWSLLNGYRAVFAEVTCNVLYSCVQMRHGHLMRLEWGLLLFLLHAQGWLVPGFSWD
jgi:hypothetical protein